MSRFLPIQAAAHAGEIDAILTLVHVLMLVLFAGWSVYFVAVLFRFRQGRHPQANFLGAKGRFALATEIGIVIAEVLLLFVIALPLWYARTAAMPADPNPVVVRIVAEQFAWNVHHPGLDGQFGPTSVALVSPSNPLGLDRSSPLAKDDVVDLSALHLPINRPVVIQLSSKDVIHSFGVPAMRLKQDAIPGLYTPIWFTPTRIGEFEIVCSQLCGLGHYRMRGVITVQSDAEFRRYLAQ